jgi:hypothetical protein
VEEWDYKTVFPRLKRYRAVLLETLRICPPIMAVPKWTSGKTQPFEVGEQLLITLSAPP